MARKLRRLFVTQPLCTTADPIGFTVRVGVTTVEAKSDPDGARRIEALLRAAGKGNRGDRGLDADRRLDADESTADLSAYLDASRAGPGGKNELN